MGLGILGQPTADDLLVDEVEGTAAPATSLVGDELERRSFDLPGTSSGGGPSSIYRAWPRAAEVRDELERRQ
jgi:hypothetical protein